MSRTDRLAAQAANCTMKRGDRVTLAGTAITGTIVQDGGYGYFKIRLDGSRRRVIRRFTEIALTPSA
jgi:hypothetical protein